MREFWDLTPREVVAVMEAAAWRMEQAQRGRAWLAWHVAALTRAKKLPPLARLLRPAGGKALGDEELAQRRAEHEELVRRIKWQ